MSEPTLIAECMPKWLQEISKKNCPDVFDEIGCYRVMEQPPITDFRIDEIRRLRELHQISEAEYQKFWSNHTEFLEKKWEAEFHNRNCYLRLLELREEHKDDLRALREIGIKIAMFAEAIRKTTNPFPALQINVEKEVVAQTADWTE